MDRDRALADMLAELAASLDTAGHRLAMHEGAGPDQRTLMADGAVASIASMTSAG